MGAKNLEVDVKKKAVDERLAEVDSFFFKCGIKFPECGRKCYQSE